jgi:hypothetical protein
VGNFEAGLAEDEVVVEENVEIEGARTVRDGGGAVAAKLVLNDEESVEEIARGERCFEREDGVEEAGLIGKADRLSGVKRRAGGDAAEGGEALGGCGERGLRRAGGTGEVGAEGDVGEGHTG